MTSDTKFRVLRATDVERCCDMRQAINAMKTAFQQLANGAATVPLRTNLPVTEQTQSLIMPVSIQGFDTFGLKAVSLTDDNAERGLPRIHASVLLFDSATGRPQSLLDGEFLTALRTGAASGLATDLLADQSASRLVIFGAGTQAYTQVMAVAAVRPIESVTVVSRNADRGHRFCDRIQAFGDFQTHWTTDSSAARNADIICTATSAHQPVFSASDLPSHCHTNAIGSYRKDMCEIPLQLMSTMTIVADQRSACLAEAGELVQAIEQGILGTEPDMFELGQLLLADRLPQLQPRTLFKSVGNAVQDLVIAQRVVDRARQMNIGQLIDL